MSDKVKGFSGNDRFQIVRELGAGGMGVVYEVLDRERNSTVALKTLKASDGLQLYRFKLEFRALTELNHPNLIQLYELFAEGDVWYFTMECVEGSTFMEYVCKSDVAEVDMPTVDEIELDTFDQSSQSNEERIQHTPIQSVDLGRLRRALPQLALGLNELHAKGMLHRDIKPANVMVTNDGRVVLLDFGLVAELNATRNSSSNVDKPNVDTPNNDTPNIDGSGAANIYESVDTGIKGTAAYMAPEQAEGKALTPAGDWYAVGTILYQALAGMIPFRGMFSQILLQKTTEDPIAPVVINGSVPRDLNDLCMGLLHRDPHQRYSGDQVLELLKPDATDSETQVADDIEIRMPDSHFVGREKQLAALDEALLSARDDGTVVVEVHGASGMGKSTLIDHFVNSLETQDDVIAIQGRCYEQETVPYKAVDGLIDALTHYMLTLSEAEQTRLLPQQIGRLARLFPVLKRIKPIAKQSMQDNDIDPRQLRDFAIAALGRLIESISESKTVVLAIDDMQWGDVDSSILINRLLQLGFAYRLLFVIGYRSEYVTTSPCLKMLHKAKWATASSAAGDTVDMLVAASKPSRNLEPTAILTSLVERIDVPILPLSSDFVRELIDWMVPRDSEIPERVIEQIIKESAGSPFFAVELVTHVQSGRSFDTQSTDGVFLDEVVWARVERLPSAARTFLELISVAGQPIPFNLAFRASRLPTLDPRDLRTLQTGRLIHSAGTANLDRITTGHDRIRESVVAHLSKSQLSQYHCSLAETLANDADADLEMIAKSFELANELPRACEFYIQAANKAYEALAFRRSAELYRKSIELLAHRHPSPDDGSTPERELFRLQQKLAKALARAGLGTQSAGEYQIAAQLTRGRERLELEGLAAFHYATGGRIEEGSQLLNNALMAVGIKIASSPLKCLFDLVRVRFANWLSGMSFTKRTKEEIDSDLLLQVDIAWRASRALTLIDALSGFCMQATMVRLALKAGEVERIVAALAWEGACIATSKFQFEIRRGERVVAEANRLAREVDSPYCLGMAALGEGALSVCTGQFSRGRRTASLADEIFREGCTAVTWERDSAQMFHIWSLIFLGEYAELTAYSEAAVFDARQRGDVYAAASHSVFALAVARLVGGDPEGAQSGMDENMADWPDSSYHVQHLLQSMSESMIGIYQGQPESGWAKMESDLRELKRSMLLEVRLLEIDYYSFKGRAAVSALALNPTSAKYRRSAVRCARRLLKSKVEWAVAQGYGISAGLSALNGNHDDAKRLLSSAIEIYDRKDLQGFAAASRINLGMLADDEHSQQQAAAGLKFLTSQFVSDIPRMTRCLSPGFDV